MSEQTDSIKLRVLAFLAVAMALAPLAHAAFNTTDVVTSRGGDFGISDYTQSPDRVYPGDEVSLKMMLYSNIPGGVLEVVAIITTPFDTTTSTITIDNVSSTEKRQISRYFSVPEGTKPGTYALYVYASARGIPQQEVAKIAFTVYEPTVTNLLTAEASYNGSVSTGASEQILVNLTNKGVLDAEDVVVRLALNTSSPFTPSSTTAST